MNNWTYRKTVVSHADMPEHHRLARTLSGKGMSVFGRSFGTGALLAAAGVLLLIVGLAGNSLALVMLGTIALVAALVRSSIEWTRRHLRHRT